MAIHFDIFSQACMVQNELGGLYSPVHVLIACVLVDGLPF